MMGIRAPTAAGLAAKGTHQLVGHTSVTCQPGQMPSSIVVPLHMQSYVTAVGSPSSPTTQPPLPRALTNVNGCTHCGNPKHTQETCFKSHGYPDWWHTRLTHICKEERMINRRIKNANYGR
ncbi:hypothetical protein ACE6H2_011179 [Prunus campanulata]